MENVEIKARIENPSDLREKVRKLADSFLGSDHQIDTYFNTKQGRMKLRESVLAGDYLIFYQRADQAGPRSSVYETIPVERAAALKIILRNLLGQDVVVEKKRDIFLYKNIRIHIDMVEGLGNFLEFEAVMDKTHSDPAVETEKVKELLQIFDIVHDDLVPVSYQDLRREQRHTIDK